MKRIELKNILLLLIAILPFFGCVEDPYVTDEDFLSEDNPTDRWIAGVQRQFALTLNAMLTDTELVSDNYYNNYSEFSKVFDVPTILYTDTDVNDMQEQIGALREMSEYGLETVIPADADATDDDKAYFYFSRAYALILAGENFVGLPEDSYAAASDWDVLLEDAITDLDSALALTTDSEWTSIYQLLKARIYRDLGDVDNAKTLTLALIDDTDLLYQIEFDGTYSVDNDMQTALYNPSQSYFEPLPRLDFLDPKYYYQGTSSTEQKPVSIVKIEEAYLILAEAYVSEGNLSSARNVLVDLIDDVVAARDTAYIDDSSETRVGSNRDDYPTTAVNVQFSSDDSLRSGYVLDRQAGDILVYTVSGTKVKSSEVSSYETEDEMLYLIYRLRQEIFIAEGRRMADLGIRFPVSQTEYLENSNITTDYLDAVIPSFIPLDYGMDDFSVDASTGDVTMTYDMNQVIVDNKATEYVVPFY